MSEREREESEGSEGSESGGACHHHRLPFPSAPASRSARALGRAAACGPAGRARLSPPHPSLTPGLRSPPRAQAWPPGSVAVRESQGLTPGLGPWAAAALGSGEPLLAPACGPAGCL